MLVTCVGDCGIDQYFPSKKIVVGGITANFARNARQEFAIDDKIRIVSCVGDDKYADQVITELKQSDIDCHISQAPGLTPRQDIQTDSNGERNFVRYEEGVLQKFEFSAEQRRIIEASDLMVAPVFRQIVDFWDRLMSIRLDGIVCIDFADFGDHPDFGLIERHIHKTDIGFFGLKNSDGVIVDRIAQIARQNDKLLVVTLAAAGSRAFRGKATFTCPAEPVSEVVDTTGAGDAYASGFMSAYCKGADIPSSMKRGAAKAAEVLGHLGAFPAAAP